MSGMNRGRLETRWVQVVVLGLFLTVPVWTEAVTIVSTNDRPRLLSSLSDQADIKARLNLFAYPKSAYINAYLYGTAAEKQAATTAYFNQLQTDYTLSMGRRLQEDMFEYDVVVSLGYWTDEQQQILLDRTVAYIEATFPAFPTTRLDWSNGGQEQVCALGLAALNFPDHPDAQTWIDASVRWTEQFIDYYFPDGAGVEGARYHDWAISLLGKYLFAIQRCTDADLFGKPGLRHALDWMIRFTSAPIATDTMPYTTPAWGDANYGANYYHFPAFACAFKTRDSDFSSRLMNWWRKTGNTVISGWEFATVYPQIVDTRLPDAPLPDPVSTYSPYMGQATLRAESGGSNEFYATFNCGYHGLSHHEADNGQIDLFAFGVPLVLDTTSGPYDGSLVNWNRQTMAHNTVRCVMPESVSLREVDGIFQAFGSSDTVDYAVGNTAYGPTSIRHVVMIKGDYMVVWDQITAASFSEWFLHVPAQSVEWQDHKIVSHTPWNADLDIHFLLPTNALPVPLVASTNISIDYTTTNAVASQYPAPAGAALYTGEGWGRYGDWTDPLESPVGRNPWSLKWLTYLLVRSPTADGDYLTVLHPRKVGVTPELTTTLTSSTATSVSLTVTYNGRTDTIVISDTGATVTKGSAAAIQFAKTYPQSGVSGAARYVKADNSLTTLSTALTTTGAVDVVFGELELGSHNRIPDTVPVMIRPCGVLDMRNRNDTVGRLTMDGGLLMGSGTLTVSAIDWYGGLVSNTVVSTGDFTKKGGLVWSPAANITYAGDTRIESGTLRFLPGGPALSGTGKVILSPGTTMDLNHTNLSFAASALTAPAGSFITTGNGMLTLTGSDTNLIAASFDGNLTHAGSARVTLTGAIATNSKLAILNGASLGVAGQTVASLTNFAGGTLVLGGTFTAGGTSVVAGSVGGAGTLVTSSALSLASTATFGSAAGVGTTGAGRFSIPSGVTVTVPFLKINNVVQFAGIWNSTRDPVHFTGEGDLVVTDGLPISPTLLATTGRTVNSISLAWQDNAGNETGYAIERATTLAGPFSQIALLSSNVTSYVNGGLANGTAYFYRVQAVNSYGVSAYSAVLSTGTLCAAPVGVVASPGDGRIRLVWTPVVGAVSNIVRRATTVGGPYAIIGLSTGSEFQDSGLVNSTTYYYVVSSVGTFGESVYSAEVFASPASATEYVWTAPVGGRWSQPVNWQNGLVADGIGNIAQFRQAAGAAVTNDVSGNAIGHLVFDVSDYSVTGNALTLDAVGVVPSISVGASRTATLSNPLAGSRGLVKSGTGTLLLSGVNALTGTMSVTAGTLAVSGGAALTDTGAVDLAAGATLRLDTTEVVGALAGAGTVALGANQLTVGGASNTVYAGVIGGTGGTLKKSGTGSLTLGAANTYTGSTLLDGGTLKYTAANTGVKGFFLGSAPGIPALGALDLNGASVTATGLTIQNNNAETNTFVIGSGRALTVNGNFSMDTAVGGTANLMVAGAGSLAINNAAATFLVGLSSDTNTRTYHLDMSGLSGGFTANVAAFYVGRTVNTYNNVPNATVKLASNSSITAPLFEIGSDATGNGGNNGGQSVTVTLGSGTNRIKASTAIIGRIKSGVQTLNFPAQGGTLIFSGTDGVSALGTMYVGYKPHTGSTGNVDGRADFSNGVVLGSVTSLYVGHMTTSQGSGSPKAIGTLTLGTAASNNLSVTTLNIGTFAGTTYPTSGKYPDGTVTVNGGHLTAGSVVMSSEAYGRALLDIKGGTVTIIGNINGSIGVYETVTLNGGTLDMTGGDLGSASTAIDTVNILSGTLRNVGAINGTEGLVKTGSGTLVVGGTNSYVGGTAISAGRLVADTVCTLGTGSVSVATGAVFEVRTANGAIGDDAALLLTGTGRADLAAGVFETVYRLMIDGVDQGVGVWDAVRDPVHFSGSGKLFVAAGYPVSPTNLATTATSAGTIELVWSDRASNETGYRIERAPVPGGAFVEIASLAANTTGYTDTGRTGNTAYFYRVRAVNAIGFSGYSEESGVVTPVPAAPSGLVAVGGDSQVSLNWNASAGATGYRVGRATVSGGPYTTIGTPVSPAYTDLTAVNETLYYYVVSATANGGEGPNALEVSAFPQGPMTSGVWTNTVNGGWSQAGNWQNNVIAGGISNSATFSQALAVTITQDRPYTTIGSLVFGTSGYVLQGGELTLDASIATPSISVASGGAVVNTRLLGASGLQKSGAGTLTLSGSNTFAGATLIREGTVEVTKIGNFNNTGGNLGTASAPGLSNAASSGGASSNPLQFWSNSAKTLRYVGSGETSDRAIYLNYQINYNASIDASGGGALVLSGAISSYLGNSSSGNSILTLKGASTDDNTLSGTFTDALKGANQNTNLRKQDAGTWSLVGNRAYNGLTLVENGTLKFNSISDAGATCSMGTASKPYISNILVPYHLALGTATTTGTLLYAGASAGSSTRVIGLNGNGTISVGTGAGTLVLNGGVSALTSGTKLLTLDGGNAGTNMLGGTVADGSGTVALRKAGPGIWTVSGTNSFTGGLTLDGAAAGTLRLGNSSALGNGVFMVSGGNNARLDVVGASLALTNNNVQVWSNNFTFAGSGSLDLGAGAVTLGAACTLTVATNTLTVGGPISGAYALTKNGAGTLVLGGTNTFTGDVTIPTGGHGDLVAKNSSAFGVGPKTVWALGNTGANRATLVFDGVAGDLQFAANLTFRTSNDSLTDPAIRNSAGNNTILGPLRLDGGGGASAIVSESGSLTLGAVSSVYASSGRTLMLGGASSGTVNGIISDGSSTVSLSKDGAGTWTLTGANAFSGTTTINAGTLRVGAASGTADSGTLATSASIVNNAALVFRRTDTADVDLAKSISGSGSVAYQGSGTSSQSRYTINDASTYSGGTAISASRLNLTVANGLGSGPVSIAAGGQIFVNAAITVTNAFTLAGLGWTESAGQLGVLRLANGALLSGPITLTGDVRLTGNSGSATVSGAITGGFGLEIGEDTAAGSVIFTGSNSYTGLTTVSFGVLNIRHSQALGTSDGGTVVVSGRELQLQGGIAVGGEPLTLNGMGVTSTGALRNMSGDNSYSGPITLASASRINSDANLLTLDVAAGNAISAVNQNLAVGGTGSITIADPIALGSGSLLKDGVGVLTLSAANIYSGGTVVSNGTLRIIAASSLPTAGLLKLCSGSTLDIASGSPIGAPATVASFDSAGATLRLSTSDRLNVSGAMTGSHVIAISDPQNLDRNQVYVVATYGGTAPTSVTLTGVSAGWAIRAVNGEIRLFFLRGTILSVF